MFRLILGGFYCISVHCNCSDPYLNSTLFDKDEALKISQRVRLASVIETLYAIKVNDVYYSDLCIIPPAH